MYQGPEYHVTKRMSFLTATVAGLSAVVVTALVCGSGIACYGLSILDKKETALRLFAESTIKGLPDMAKNLPPLLADSISDFRSPEYTKRLQVKSSVHADPNRDGVIRPVIEIRNTGDEVVSLLAVHAVLLDDNGTPCHEWTEYMATPVALKEQWRGPMMPGATRIVPLDRVHASEKFTLSCEVTELRLWDAPATDDDATDAKATQARADRPSKNHRGA